MDAIGLRIFALDIEIESTGGKKQPRGSTSTKRSRAAEVHNLSERRRRDRINEKMRALQELIPRCNKSDKASMLDEAIEYLKSLQLQVQMMSMGCGMIPMMYPGVQQYIPAMGMGMDMGMNRPMMPYPALMPTSGMPIPPAANMGPIYPVPAYHMQPVPVPDPSRLQAAGQSDPMLSSMIPNIPNQPRMPNYSDPYQQYMGLHQAQMPIPQTQVAPQPPSNKPSSSRNVANPENQDTGTLILLVVMHAQVYMQARTSNSSTIIHWICRCRTLNDAEGKRTSLKMLCKWVTHLVASFGGRLPPPYRRKSKQCIEVKILARALPGPPVGFDLFSSKCLCYQSLTLQIKAFTS
ncbi:hypothetical protein M9H77_01241 [Catharanthus roseus]|uniref:Uncharacterized protein n=1 Tax=Catharanthus roseus TaxID=4058 RepID=A0ACC0C518_CATRO|nr:hypothetical protein M9H77_01241 [Catharanthus roseus]